MFKPFFKIQLNLITVLRKKPILLALFILFCTLTHAQYARWMMGTWKSTSSIATIQINDVSRESFTGIKTIETNNTKITISVSGAFRGRGFYLQDGEVLSKEPANAQWSDCSACTEADKIIVGHDSLILIRSISDCDAKCDGETYYYRLLSEYDSASQRYLVDRFGRPSDIIGFRPQRPQEGVTPISIYDNEPEKNNVAVAAVPDEKRLQHINDSVRIAQQKKRQQQIADSLNLVQQKQHVKDSLGNVAKLERIRLRTEDSLRDSQAKKRQQEVTDSINLVKQKEQQRLKDSLNNVAGIRQRQIQDSILLEQQKARKQEITDSLNLVKQKEQQRLKDSLDNIARLEKIRLQTEDSLRDVLAKKRQQEIADSINLAKQKEQQLLKDSLDNVARIRQQQIQDSTLLAQHKKREQEITDSLNLVKQKEQQRLKDSLDNVARLEKIRLQTEDSLRNVQIKKRQQEVADSLNLVNERKQQHIIDSLQNVAAANLQKQQTADSLREVQARIKQQQADSLVALRTQRYNDSLQKAALAKTAPPATTGSGESVADKALTSRTSVLLKTYHINSPDILIELFDNGEIDSDRVSIYHNNAVIVSNQVLGIKPITLKVHADATNREHEFVMVAENLGSIPPNSALMRITAGKQSYKLSVNTDMKTNARIVFYYDGN